MSEDFVYILTWWLMFLIVGLINFPLCFKLFGKFTDRGYGVSKILGFVLTSYLVFFFGITKILPFTLLTITFALLLIAAINAVILLKNKNKILSFIRHNPRVLILQETLFTSGYVFWSLVRGYHPDINGLEKLMDQGFINSILRSTYLPPVDMWFAGEPINYYWFGHFWVALATKLSGIPSYITYNLMLATILGLALTAAFSLVSTIVANLKLKFNKRLVFLAGIISAAMLVFAGNLHTPIYLAKEGRAKYWYPDATRFIGYNPETDDKTIHEFPMYSFVVSDLHAHLINFPIVLLYISLLFAAVSSGRNTSGIGYQLSVVGKKLVSLLSVGQVDRKQKDLYQKTENRKQKTEFSILGFSILLLGFVLGLMFITSTWDFGSYLMVTGFVMLFAHFAKQGINIESLFRAGIHTFIIAVIGGITALPFILNFESIAQGVDFVNSRSPLWQLGVLWGFPAIMTAIYLYTLGSIGIKKIKLPDVFALSLLAASWVLILLPEIIYVKDIYIASHHRANTMFKLTYQAFVMFYLLSGYIAIRTVAISRGVFAKVLLSVFYTCMFFSLLSYAYFSTTSYYRDLKVYRGLDGETWLLSSRPETYATVLWFRQNVEGQPVILEAPGDSYTEYNVVSSYTGLPTVSGWFVHEWLWRGSSEIPQARVNDINTIYTSFDTEHTKQLLRKYNVEYVIVGNFEREKFPNLIEDKFSELGQLVYSNEVVNIYKINP
jgi:uncharacterized membrane protein